VSFPRRGEIYWVNLEPTVGTEIAKTRPALIISNDKGAMGEKEGMEGRGEYCN